MNTKTPVIALLLAAIMLLAGCSSAIQPNTTNQTNTSVDESQTTTYVSTDLEQCKLIRYMCTEGKEAFTDTNGCGCKPTSQVQFPDGQTEDVFYVATNVTVCAATTFLCDSGKQMFFNESGCGCKTPTANDEPKKTFCTPEQRNAPTTEEYRQVCGWFGEKVQCFAFPCAIAAENPSKACANPDVEYYTDGECPPVGGNAAGGTTLNYDEQIERMTPIVVKTVKGQTGVESSIQCHPSRTAAKGETPQVVNGYQACTADYTEVDACDTYLQFNENTATLGITNQFLACVDMKTNAVSPSSRLPSVSDDKACTMQYDPVCAEFYDGTTHTFGNACGASNVIGIIGTTAGECAAPAEPKRVVLDCAQSYIDMQDQEVAACTKEYMPVCASDSNGVSNTFSNKCGACTTKGVTQYTEGACNDSTGATI